MHRSVLDLWFVTQTFYSLLWNFELGVFVPRPASLMLNPHMWKRYKITRQVYRHGHKKWWSRKQKQLENKYRTDRRLRNAINLIIVRAFCVILSFGIIFSVVKTYGSCAAASAVYSLCVWKEFFSLRILISLWRFLSDSDKCSTKLLYV